MVKEDKDFKDLIWVLLQENLGQIHTLMSVFWGIYFNYINREQREYDMIEGMIDMKV